MKKNNYRMNFLRNRLCYLNTRHTSDKKRSLFHINDYIRNLIFFTKIIGVLYFFNMPNAYASRGPAMPWDSGLQQIQNALTGNTAHALIILAIALTGIGIALGEHDSIFRKAICIIFGGSIAVGAVSLYSTLNLSGAGY